MIGREGELVGQGEQGLGDPFKAFAAHGGDLMKGFHEALLIGTDLPGISAHALFVITSYSIHYTKLYERA